MKVSSGFSDKSHCLDFKNCLYEESSLRFFLRIEVFSSYISNSKSLTSKMIFIEGVACRDDSNMVE